MIFYYRMAGFFIVVQGRFLILCSKERMCMRVSNFISWFYFNFSLSLFPLAHCIASSDVIHHKKFMRFLGWILNMKWRWGLVLWFPCKQITILKLVDAFGSLSRRVCVILKKIKITKKRKKKLMSKHPFACCFKFYIFRQEFKKLITVWRDRIVD